jgi:RNA polymerase sigma factor (sigma-70 family)
MKVIDPGDLSDESLVLRVQQHRDQVAFDELFRRYYKPIYRFFALSVWDDPATREDLTQETFCKAARGLPKLREGTSFKNWLYQIARNILRDYLRQRRVREGSGQVLPLEAENDIEDPNNDVERQVSAIMCLAQALEEMTFAQQECLRLCAQGFIPQEIVEHLMRRGMKLTVGTVKQYISQGRKKLRDALYGPSSEC